MHIVVALRVNENDDLSVQNSKRHHPFLAVIYTDVLTRDGKVVPNGIGPFEIQPMKLDVAPPLGLVSIRHKYIVFTINSVSKPVLFHGN